MIVCSIDDLEFDYTINCGDLTFIDQNHDPTPEAVEKGTSYSMLSLGVRLSRAFSPLRNGEVFPVSFVRSRES